MSCATPEPCACGRPARIPTLALRQLLLRALQLRLTPEVSANVTDVRGQREGSEQQAEGGKECAVLLVKRMNHAARRVANSLSLLGAVYLAARARGCDVWLHSGPVLLTVPPHLARTPTHQPTCLARVTLCLLARLLSAADRFC